MRCCSACRARKRAKPRAPRPADVTSAQRCGCVQKCTGCNRETGRPAGCLRCGQQGKHGTRTHTQTHAGQGAEKRGPPGHARSASRRHGLKSAGRVGWVLGIVAGWWWEPGGSGAAAGGRVSARCRDKCHAQSREQKQQGGWLAICNFLADEGSGVRCGGGFCVAPTRAKVTRLGCWRPNAGKAQPRTTPETEQQRVVAVCEQLVSFASRGSGPKSGGGERAPGCCWSPALRVCHGATCNPGWRASPISGVERGLQEKQQNACMAVRARPVFLCFCKGGRGARGKSALSLAARGGAISRDCVARPTPVHGGVC